jgi:hypothetical protein
MSNQPKTREEWFKLIEEYKKSGLKQSIFCKQKELVPSRLSYYFQRYHQQQKNTALQPPSFSQVMVQLPTPSVNEIKIELPNGFRCFVPSNIQPEQLKRMLGVLLTC